MERWQKILPFDEIFIQDVSQGFYRLCHPFIGHFRRLVKIPSSFLGLMLYFVPESKLVKISHLDSFLLAVLLLCFCWMVSILDTRPCTVIGDAIVTLQQVIEYLWITCLSVTIHWFFLSKVKIRQINKFCFDLAKNSNVFTNFFRQIFSRFRKKNKRIFGVYIRKIMIF